MRVLLVEDEPLLLMSTSDMLAELGYEVVGMATSVQAGVKAAHSSSIEIAVLDVNLGGERVDALASLLATRGIPFVFTTGYGVQTLPAGFADRPHVGKPFETEQLGQALQAACRSSVATA